MPVPPMTPGSLPEVPTPADQGAAPVPLDPDGGLVRGRSRLETSVHHLPGVIFLLDTTLCICEANPAWSQVTGLPLSDVLGKPITSLVYHEDSEPCLTYLQGVLDGDDSASAVDIRFFGPGPAEEWFILRAARLPEGGLACVLHNVTERRRIETSLRRHEEAVHTLYSVTTSPHLSLNEKVHALLVLGCQYFTMDAGFLTDNSGTRVELKEVYAPDSDFSAGMTLPLEETYSREILRAGGFIEILDASQAGWSQHPAYLSHPYDSFIGIPVMAGDVPFGVLSFGGKKPRPGPLSASEKELLRLMSLWIGSEIEQEINTGQMRRYAEEIDRINQALITTRDEAVEAAGVKSEFLATISHEIRTPINAIIGMTDFLLDSPLTAPQKEYATIVHDSASMLLALINDILDFSKIEAGKLELECIPFSPLDLVESVIDMFAASAYEKGLEISACVDPAVPDTLMGDPTRLRQVISNLVGNGIKFTETGRVSVTARLLDTGENGTRLRFEVSDTGIGLTEDARARLFQPFTQADGSISRIYGGTGLGLAISRRLVESMHGEISVQSAAGKGSLFWFTAAFPPAVGLVKPEAEPNSLQGKRILLAVDDPALNTALSTYLKASGADVFVIDAPANIVPMLQTAKGQGHPFSHLILDLVSPEGSPQRINLAVRSHADLNDLRIIALTGYGEHPDGTSHGFIPLPKPVKKQVLIQAVLQTPAAGPGQPTQSSSALSIIERRVDWLHDPAAASPYILLAEDNPANLRLATLQLQKLGYRVETAASGRQAVEMLIQTNHKYAAVLMDCQMSDVDGLSATRIIRKSELDTGRHVPIIAVTANALPGDREKCLAAGMDDYLSKPISLDLMGSMLARWAGNQGESPAGGAPPEPIQVQPRPLDAASLQAIRALQIEGQPDFLTELIDIYLNDSARHMASMQNAIASSEFDILRRAAHSLRGASTNMGAHALAAFLSEVEKQAAFGFGDDAPEMMNRVEEEYRRVVNALQAERKTGIPEA